MLVLSSKTTALLNSLDVAYRATTARQTTQTNRIQHPISRACRTLLLVGRCVTATHTGLGWVAIERTNDVRPAVVAHLEFSERAHTQKVSLPSSKG
mgnify:CR=1 FL=1|jgi:hypothetical protein